jgi:type II secretion system protein G
MKANIFNKKTKLARGFTLIELLVVISIIGMLASVVLVSLQGARNKAKDLKFVAGLRELQKAMELYRLDNNRYPGGNGTDGNWHTGVGCSSYLAPHTIDELFDANFKSRYMSALPSEVVSCGFYYAVMPGGADATSGACASPDTGVVHPDGYNNTGAGLQEHRGYSYLLRFKVLTNSLSVKDYPVFVYPNGAPGSYVYNPDYSSTERCILGPKL